jgi:trimeric autotransporter adhesin
MNMKKAYLLLLPVALLSAAASAQSGIINTVAGDGIAGFAGDGTSALTAKFDTMQFIALDDSANIYIADAQNNRIRKVYAKNGLITTIAGNGVAGYTGDYGLAVNAEIFYPVAIGIGPNGDVYFTDNGNGVVRRITKSTGIIHTFAGDGIGGSSGDDSAATNAKFESPTGIAVDGSGNVYISDAGNSNIRVVLASDSDIYEFAGIGTAGYSGDGGPASAAELNEPLGIALDNLGNLYVADWHNALIRKINISSGTISSVAGIAGNFTPTLTNGPATGIPISYPTDVACDKLGNFYISDVGTNVIRGISASSGYEFVVAGEELNGYSGDGGPATSAELNYPIGVGLDTNSNIYIADLLNFRIRIVSSTPLAVPQISASGSFAIYPNPVSNNLNIVFSSTYTSGRNTIEIIDITGRTVTSLDNEVAPNSTLSVDVSTLSSGMYFIKVADKTSSQVFKFIKE